MRKIKFRLGNLQDGQALVEYALIIVLVVIAFAVALAATGPAIGNVFSNTMCTLIQQEGCGTPLRVLPDRNAFWATVTWAAQQTPMESPFPTNPPIPPPPTATAGPSPTPSPTRPTNTPIPSPTFTPSPTATDFNFQAPDWYERANPDTAIRWRLDNSAWLGANEWIGDYFPNTTLGGTADFRRGNSAVSLPRFDVNVNWLGTTSPQAGWPASSPGDNFSARWFRTINVQAAVSLSFTLRSGGGGARFYIVGPGRGGSVSDPASGGSCGAPCLVINDWTNHGTARTSTPVTVNLTANTTYLMIVEYYNQGSNVTAEVALSYRPLGQQINPNDTAAPANCNWGRQLTDSSNSQTFMWDEYLNGTIAANTRCTLEFRGYVTVPGTLASPHFIFWSAWDFGNAATVGRLEFAKYEDRANPAAWRQIELFRGGSVNYNWTRFSINLASAGIPGYVANQPFNLTFRFVIDNGAVSGTTARHWYLDDMTIQTFSPDSTNYTVGRSWNLDQASERNDFLATENWVLSAENPLNATGMSWSDSPTSGTSNPYPIGAVTNIAYQRFEDADCSGSPANCPAPIGAPGQPTTSRVYYIEFNGWVDVSGNLPDLDGDTGPAILSFQHAYRIGTGVRLEVQYTRDPFVSTAGSNASVRTTWTRVPGPANMDGTIVTLAGPRTQGYQLREVQLDGIPNFDTQRFRLRFAMIVDSDAVEDDGWWIDRIQIERMTRPRFTPYPFFDDAEITDANWRFGGGFARYQMPSVFNVGAWVYTDSPLGNYFPDQDMTMTLAWPIDLRNDSPDNLNPPNSTPIPTPGNQGGVATRPILSFWHKRNIASGDAFYVEWRRYRDTTGPWYRIWDYTFNGSTDNQIAWERVVIDFDPVNQMVNTANPADLTDDDIVFRFRLASVNNITAQGIQIDNVTFENYTETDWRLWNTAVDPDGGGPLQTGSGEAYLDGIDVPTDWWNRWYTGGDWTAIDWNTRIGGGLRSFHDSPTGQSAAPFYFSPSNLYDGVNYSDATFSALEMRQIMDLRGIDVTRRPTLEFWHRYWVGTSDTLRVQVSVENTTAPTSTAPCGGTVGNFGDPPRQCYGRTANWDAWQTVFSLVGERRNHSWTRQIVDLSGYVGRRIRVRFVTDAYTNASNRDGWYIDNIRFFYNNFTTPLPYQLTFFDAARNMDRWIPEGAWGLDPERYYGSGGGPADLGTSPWNAYWFSPAGCCSATSAATFLNGIPDTPAGYNTARTNVGVGNYFPDSQPQFLMDINFEFGSSGPRYGNGTVWRSSNFLARFTRDVTAQGGEYTFITISDDGIRMKYTPGPGGGSGNCAGWNIICNWTAHGRTVDLRAITFPSPGNYRLIVEWYESSGEAIVVVSTGSNNFSFSDSPKLGVGPSFPEFNSTSYSSSSLVLDGVIDMCGARAPVLEFRTVYDTHNDSNNALDNLMNVEITTNGGIDWTLGNFNGPPGGHDGNRPPPVVTPTPLPISGFSGSSWTGSTANLTVWELRRYNLWAYINRYMGLRFRLSTQAPVRNGWWIAEIIVGAASVTPRASLPPGTCP